MGIPLAKNPPAAAALDLWRSTVGKKIVMAVTGLILFGYIVLHLWGNLKVYEGPVAVNTYGVWLRSVGDPLFSHEQLLWIVRVVLLVSVVLHVWAAVALWKQDADARPVGYAMRKSQAYGYAGSMMRWGGLAIALFVLYHILHFTTGTLHEDFEEGNVYHNLVVGFSVWWVDLIYIAAIIALATHLYHGLWSMMQTLGAMDRRTDRFWRGLAAGITAVIAVGYISIPIAVLLGIVG